DAPSRRRPRSAPRAAHALPAQASLRRTSRPLRAPPSRRTPRARRSPPPHLPPQSFSCRHPPAPHGAALYRLEQQILDEQTEQDDGQKPREHVGYLELILALEDEPP